MLKYKQFINEIVTTQHDGGLGMSAFIYKNVLYHGMGVNHGQFAAAAMKIILPDGTEDERSDLTFKIFDSDKVGYWNPKTNILRNYSGRKYSTAKMKIVNVRKSKEYGIRGGDENFYDNRYIFKHRHAIKRK